MATFLHGLLAWFVVIEVAYGIAMLGFGVYAKRYGDGEPWAIAALSAALLVWSQGVRTFRFASPYDHYALVWGLLPSLMLLCIVYFWSRDEPMAILFRLIATIPVFVATGIVAYALYYHHIYTHQEIYFDASH